LNLREELHHSLFRGLKSLAAIDLPTQVTFEDLQIWLKYLNLLVPQEGFEPLTPSLRMTARAFSQPLDPDSFSRVSRGETLDYLSGNQPGYSGKLLGGAQVKKFGPQSLGNVLGAVGTYLALVEDPAQMARFKAVADAVAALAKVAALGMSAAEFERLARSRNPASQRSATRWPRPDATVV
jgi:hypothetical protein